MRIKALALAAGLLVGGGTASGTEAAAGTGPPAPDGAATAVLEPSPVLRPLPGGDAARSLPIVLQADRIRSRPDLETVAEGHVEFRRGGLVLSTDRLAYDMAQDLASARGHVRVEQNGAVYTGPELELRVQRFEGYFLEPTFEFATLGAGGRADRVDFLGPGRFSATNASYTSCPRDGPEEPDWVLQTRRISLDMDANEGVAEGAVLHFLGAPILALPVMSFPLTDARKSGWLPPSVNVDNRSGVELAVPYYWNIAPNRDATITPRVMTRRGLGLDTEFRYLEPRFEGGMLLQWLPNDQVAERSREALQWRHEGLLGRSVRYGVDLARVSDDDWWKDFPDAGRGVTARLLPLRLQAERPFGLAGGTGEVYARALRWQVLQAADSLIESPYERSPQVGARFGAQAGGWHYALQAEFNRFTLPHDQELSSGRTVGDRLHMVGSLTRPVREPGWWLVPGVSFNAANYFNNASYTPGVAPAAEGRRLIPTFSVDGGLEFERNTAFFGRNVHQTLEPRVLYVKTPYRSQNQLPNYDSAAKDFNFVSIYSENAFSGVDRVSDSHQITAGVTTRVLDDASGAEALRLVLVQRYLLSPQLVAPQADGSPDGEPLTQRFSDALLVGSTSVIPGWVLEAAVQYSPEVQRSVRSVASVRWSPGPFRTVGTTYRLARGLSEQLEVGWQWPVYRSAPAGSGGCSGALYTVGHVNYSLKDRRATDSVLGLEYDAGCWIGRVVAKQQSISASEKSTQLMLQLELVGLSRIGSNPLKVLKENIPGYRLLRDDAFVAAP
ncbi:MAG TPA: LPS assembly protein LptD [Rubrivivax sp.]|nr:LPS assembly protein LptD [Rubrivivax sp.]